MDWTFCSWSGAPLYLIEACEPNLTTLEAVACLLQLRQASGEKHRVGDDSVVDELDQRLGQIRLLGMWGLLDEAQIEALMLDIGGVIVGIEQVPINEYDRIGRQLLDHPLDHPPLCLSLACDRIALDPNKRN